MCIGESRYKKFILVMFIGTLLLSSGALSSASSAGQKPHMVSNTLGGIANGNSGSANYSKDGGQLVVGAGPGAILYLPLGFITTGRPTFIWSKVAGANLYGLIVLDSDGNTVINQWFMAESLRPDRKSRLSTILPITLTPGDYTWQIQTLGSSSTSSNPNPFTVCTSKSLPGKPILISPRNTIGTVTPLYVWNPVPGALQYHLKVVNAKTSALVINQWYNAEDVLSNHGASVRNFTALPSGTYKWWVQAGNCLGTGLLSDPLNFVISPSKPGGVSPISPDGLITTRTPIFVWTATPSATEYNLTVENETVPKLNETFLAEDVTQGNKCYAMLPEILPTDDIDFFWKVQAVNEQGAGPNSSLMWFETVCGGEKAAKKTNQ